jgi:hypothetical protein
VSFLSVGSHSHAEKACAVPHPPGGASLPGAPSHVMEHSLPTAMFFNNE